MKTNHNYKASNNLLGAILLLSLLSTAFISINVAVFSDLFTAFESQWMGLTNSMSGFMVQVRPAQW